MRVKYQKLVGLLMVLAIVCSLVAITVAPASATAVTAVVVTASPAQASSTAGYTLAFTTATGVPVGGTVTITFPTGVTLPATILKSLISLNGITWGAGDADPTVSGQQVIITIPSSGAWTAGNKTITISQGAGITNPPIAKTKASLAYPVSVVTSADTTAGIGYMGIIPSCTISPTSGTRSTSVTVTGKGWAPNQSITISNALSGSGIVLADGTFSLTATPLTSGNVTCTDGAGQINVQTGGSVVWDYAVTMASFYLSATVTVTPTSGNVGTSVLISGRDFTSGGNISATNGIFMGGANWNPAAIIMLSTVDAFGTLDDFNTALVVPANIGGGAKTILVTDGTKTATATFTVNTPTITLNPAMGAPNTLVSITGAHFAAGDTVPANGIKWNGAGWNTGLAGAPGALMIDASGNWNTNLYVPATAAIGNNPVVVTSTQGTTAAAVFAVGQRALTITPASGPLGTTVVIQGTNMTTSGHINAGLVTFAGYAWNTAQISIDSLGNMSPTPLALTEPPLDLSLIGTGPQSVTATDSGGITAVGTFTVTQPTISISPTTGYMGDSLTVTGAGWLPGNAGLVQVKFNGVFVWSTVPHPDGTFSGGFIVPVTAVASNTVSATDIAGNTAPDKTFLLGPQAMTISPTSGPVGTKVTVTGVGFQPLSALSVLTIGGASVLPATPVTTDNTGKFTTSFSVPGLAQIAQTVTGKVAAIEATTFFTITAAPAAIDVQLASISSNLVIVWRYKNGNWTYYDPTDPVRTLESLESNDGFWVKVSAACTLTYLGNSIALDADWNNKGWPAT